MKEGVTEARSEAGSEPVSASEWAGRAGEVWRENQVFLDRMLALPGEAALEVASPMLGERILEIGCGAGAMTIELLERAGRSGHVTAVDISPQLLARARERIGSHQPVTLINEDAAGVELPKGAYDLIFSRFGVMFFTNPVRAFEHLRGFLKPGGRMVFVCWRALAQNEWLSLPLAVAGTEMTLPTNPDFDSKGPFAFSDSDTVSSMLVSAGFSSVTFRRFDASLTYGESESREEALSQALNLTLRIGPVSKLLSEAPGDTRRRVAESMRQALLARTKVLDADGKRHNVSLGGAAWVVSARNP